MMANCKSNQFNGGILENDKKLKEVYGPYHDNANQITFNITSLRIIHGKAIENLFEKHAWSCFWSNFIFVFSLFKTLYSNAFLMINQNLSFI